MSFGRTRFKQDWKAAIIDNLSEDELRLRQQVETSVRIVVREEEQADSYVDRVDIG